MIPSVATRVVQSRQTGMRQSKGAAKHEPRSIRARTHTHTKKGAALSLKALGHFDSMQCNSIQSKQVLVVAFPSVPFGGRARTAECCVFRWIERMFFSWDGCSLGEMRCNTVPYWRGRTMHALSPPFCSIQQTASRLHSVQQLSATWQIRYFARFLGRFILIFPLRYSCRCFFSFLGRSVLVYSAFLRQMNETNQSTINQPSIK
mmetsp:Transcript_23319/g.48969  ORF Transcript_23319/g.48969 Transcript_23319/m.48969 type:complete len:204 (+) Transcript_23319:173-784(+)